MRRLIWMIMPALLLAGPAWGWCDKDSDDESFCPKPTTNGVPEPGSLALMLLGLGSMSLACRKRKQ